MKILTVDLRMIHASGIGTYIKNIVPQIIAYYPDYKFNFIGNINEMSEFSWAHGANITLIECLAPIYSIIEQIELAKKIPSNTSLFWSPHYNYPLLYGGKLLVTVHDIIHLAMPQYFPGIVKRVYAKVMFTTLKYKAHGIVAVSKFTCNELQRLVGVTEKKIVPVYNGIDASWFNITPHSNPHSKPFIFFVGNVKPHKNLVNLVKAFELLINKIPHDLIIIGKKDGFITGDNEVTSMVNLLAERIKFTGFISDEALRQYFVHADALVFPSLYEGFGFPPLEAMACKCPVLISNIPCLTEVCGNAALQCNPYSPKDIANKIEQIINDTMLREELRHKGVERAKQFTWDICAENTAKVILEVLTNENCNCS